MASASRFLLSRLAAAAASSSRLLRPLAAAGSLPAAAAARCFATLPATSSMRDSSPNWSRGPPKETILLDGCDFEHWLVVMDPPPGDPSNPDPSRDEIIDDYIKTVARVVGSEEEARHKIYSVSTRHYFAFGALVSEELTYKLKELPKVRWVLPDSYLDVRNKDYGGEPFINGEAVPYDPKYHEEWVRNNARANERTRRNDRPRNFDRSRNFERRRENTQNFQNRDVPPGQGFNSPPPPGQGPVPPRDAPPMHHAQGNVPPPPPPNAGAPPSYHPHAPNPQASYTNYQQGGAPGYQGSNQGYQGPPPPPHSAYQGNNPGYQGGGPGYQGDNPPPYQGGNPGYAPGYHGQGGNPSYQQGGDNYNTGAPAYERDGQGRNYQ